MTGDKAVNTNTANDLYTPLKIFTATESAGFGRSHSFS